MIRAKDDGEVVDAVVVDVLEEVDVVVVAWPRWWWWWSCKMAHANNPHIFYARPSPTTFEGGGCRLGGRCSGGDRLQMVVRDGRMTLDSQRTEATRG